MEKGRVRATEDGDRRIIGTEQMPTCANVVGNDLGFLRAALDALAATDAAVVDDLCIIAMDANRFDRTIADAGVTFSAVFLDGDDLAHGAPLTLGAEIVPFMARACQSGIMDGVNGSF